MAKAKRATAPRGTLSTRPVASLVKKDLTAIRAQADKLRTFLKDPNIAAIRICECCIQIS
jgi:hypothetical protein